MDNMEEIRNKLEKYGQQHLLAFYDDLTIQGKLDLVEQIQNIDFEQADELFKNKDNVKIDKDTIEPMPYVDRLKLSNEEMDKYIALGESIIKSNKYALVTMAGGQGTRLGHDGPKGTYKLDIEPNKSLFEITCDTLKSAKRKYNIYMMWYIMTSRENNNDTVDYFEKNNYFGYPKEKIKFFKQEQLPMFGVDGKILLETKGKVREAADGHGGVFEAMSKNGIIEHMKKQGIQWIFIGGIDNVLLHVIDPLFIGMAQSMGVLAASKSIVKARPDEKVGVFCKRNGRPSVIEYTEITEDMANMSDDEGELLYGESHILCNLFNIKALEMIKNKKIPYHTAFKKSPYIDANGNEVSSMIPNAYKFEAFIFDAFSMMEDMLILRSVREEEFAPVKNKEGIDSPETAKKLYNNYWSK